MIKTNFLLILIFLILLVPLTYAQNSEEEISFLNITLDGSSALRSGDIFIIKPTITNLGKDNASIEKIKIISPKKEKIREFTINKNILPVKEQIDRLDSLKLSSLENKLELKRLRNEVRFKSFSKAFYLNINDFSDSLNVGDIVIIPLELKIYYNHKKYIVEINHTILISEPLPTPPHNSPGWYVGDQHMHTDIAYDGSVPLSEMIDESISEGLDWVIFTDHSNYLDSEEWNGGYNSCVGNSTSSFKCLYGQEMAVDAPGINDAAHYLTHPSSDDNLGYIDGTCTFWNSGCRDAQDVIDEVENAGGIGFIAHPYDGFPYYLNWEDWSVTGYSGLELINAKDGIFEGGDQETINQWEDLLIAETNPDNGFIVGIAGSDAHQISEVGHTFTYCYLDSETLTTSAIRESYKDGHCIASTGPFVQFTLDGNIIGSVVDAMSGINTLDISASSNGEFGDITYIYIYLNDQFYDYIPVSDDTYSGSFDIDLDTSDDYIRLEVYTDTGRRAYTNPIWVDVTSCSCSSWSEGSCGGGSCSASQKQWTRDCTPDVCATESQCVYDEDCEEEEAPVEDCEESGYEFCIESSYEDCDVSIAQNLYENVNDIEWGAVNDAWDPYVIDEYKIGWKDVDAQQMYYDCDGDYDCEYGGCDCDEINDEDTMVTVTAPGTAYRDEILGYDDTLEQACWIWWYPFSPNYGVGNSIYVLNCFDDGDCSANQYCDKSSSWSNWDCVSDKSNGQSCISDSQCSSGYCDDDGVGLGDDGWCFTPYNTYFDGQETSYCEYSIGSGHVNCDERQTGDDLNLCSGTSYYEDECSSTCSYQDITSVFECAEAGCSCDEFLCDGKTTGDNITTCFSGEPYFADKCTSVAGGEDRDNVCRNSTFDSGCTADSRCEGIVAGTGNCDLACNFVLPDTYKFTHKNSLGEIVAWFGDEGNIVLAGSCFSGGTCNSPGADSFIIRNSTNNNVAFINSTGDLCLVTGDCSDQSATCNPSRDAFIIQDSTFTNMSYIDFDGDLCLKGSLFENVEL